MRKVRKMLKMSDMQRVIVLAAVAREDRCCLPAANARRPALKSFAERLVDAGWAKEVKTTDAARIWRKNPATGEVFALRLTAKGVRAVGAVRRAEEVADGAPVASVTPAAGKPSMDAPASRTTTAARTEPTQAAPMPGAENSTPNARAPRSTSKLGRVLEMLTADAGTTIGDLTAATGWLEHTTRAALTGLRRRGYELSLTRKERDGASVYRIVASEAAK
jgi:hypothetical protein